MNFYRKVLKGKAILTIDKTTLCDEVIIKIPNVDSTGGMRVSNNLHVPELYFPARIHHHAKSHSIQRFMYQWVSTL
ncbi:uncharacterized protein LOC143907466 isoform X2 [Temnothorax americanus]|uniref:uncharacterized protein LOC143907466 isoform X2 n=1 Tax=Temnothorax americanus TaxID=1964332 RepID=UPI0040677C8D